MSIRFRLDRLRSSEKAAIVDGLDLINFERTRGRRRIVWTALAGLAGGGALSVWMQLPFPVIAGVIVLAVVATRETRAARRTFKEFVVQRIIGALEGVKYNAASSFGMPEFLSMDLYRTTAEYFSGEDEIRGRSGDVSYSLQECRAWRVDGAGKHRRTTVIFNGIIAQLEFTRQFAGHTVVLPNSESQRLGGLLSEAETRHGKQLVRMDDAMFEQEFSVYSNDETQTRRILTSRLMQTIREAGARFGKGLRMSFRANSLCIAIPERKNRFEVSLFGAPITSDAVLADLGELVELAESLIGALDPELASGSRS